MIEEDRGKIVISPSQLPMFTVANAIHITYNATIVRLANALNLEAFQPIDTFLYRVYVNNTLTGESCCIVQKGATEMEPTGLPFQVFISFMAILQIKFYQATYSGGGATIYITDEDLVSRATTLFAERPEFELWDILCVEDDKENDHAPTQAQDQEAKAAQLPAPASQK